MRVWLRCYVYVSPSIRYVHNVIYDVAIACLHGASSRVCPGRVVLMSRILYPTFLLFIIIIGLICFKIDPALLLNIRCIFEIFKTLYDIDLRSLLIYLILVSA